MPVRSAAWAVVIGALTFILTITLFLTVLGVGPNSDGSTPTIAERGADLLNRQLIFKIYWTVEALAMGLFAAGAFVLAFCLPPERAAPLGWSLIGTGSLANLGMYAFALGSYFAAATYAAEIPALFEVANAAALAIFFVANALAFLGVFLTFAAEIGREKPSVPRLIAVIGALAGFVAFCAGAAGPIIGNVAMLLAGPAAMIGYVLIAVLAFRVSRD